MSITISGQTAAAPATQAGALPGAPGAESGGDLFAILLGANLGTLQGLMPGADVPRPGESGAAKTARTLREALAADDPKKPVVAAVQPDAPIVALQSVLPVNPQQPVQTVSDTAPAATDVLAETVQLPGARKHAGATPLGDVLQDLPQAGRQQVPFLPQQPVQDAHAARPATPPAFNVPAPITDPAWSRQLSDHMLSMVSLKAEQAHIQLSPAELGPIEVTLKLNPDNTAQLTFNAASATTREALENSLPKLSAMLSAGGVQLSDAQIFGGQQQNPQQQGQKSRQGLREEEAMPEEADALSMIRQARNMLSIFA